MQKRQKQGDHLKSSLNLLSIRSILKRAVEFSEINPPSPQEERKNACKKFQEEMSIILNREWTDADAIRISKELRKRQPMLCTFLKFEGVPWHNNSAERAMRKGVLHRKISGGRRTWPGVRVFELLLSINETSKIRTQRFMKILEEKFEIAGYKRSKNTYIS